jgi:uncharacterized phage protein gp47/JayE
MATSPYKTPNQVADEYLRHLKGIRPDVNTDQTDTDWWVKAKVNGGIVSGAYADQRKIANDAFPQSARHEALEKHLNTYFNTGFNAAEAADGIAYFTGATGSTLTAGKEFTHLPTGNVYVSTEDAPLGTATTGTVPVVSVSTGQGQNLLAGALLSISSPPAGIDTAATAFTDIANGRNDESDSEAAQRILDRIRTPIAGGNETDYPQWARDADPSVTSAKIRRWYRGLGTVAVFITSGTTDIDEAIDNGQAIVKVPSQALIDKVAAYIDALNPTTDCSTVLPIDEATQDVTVRVRYKEGLTGGTILAGQTLTCEELVQREVSRALYKIPTGGRLLGTPASGFVLASEIEEVLDAGLSTSPYQQGVYAEILADRQVSDLSASGVNRGLIDNEVVIPGVISVAEM